MVITSMAGPSTRFPAKSVVETSSCEDEKIKEIVFWDNSFSCFYVPKTVNG